MKKSLLTVLFLCTSVFAIYAKSPQPLDPATISSPVPVTSITIVVTKNVDTDNQGKNFMTSVFPTYFDLVSKSVYEQSKITIDTSEYLAQVKDSNIDIKYEDVSISKKMIINQYYWKSAQEKSPRASLTLAFVIRDDHTMPLTVTITEDDPANKSVKKLTLQVPLLVVNESDDIKQ